VLIEWALIVALVRVIVHIHYWILFVFLLELVVLFVIVGSLWLVIRIVIASDRLWLVALWLLIHPQVVVDLGIGVARLVLVVVAARLEKGMLGHAAEFGMCLAD